MPTSSSESHAPGIGGLGYVLLQACDLEAWRGFGTSVVGAMEVAMPGQCLGLKIDEHPYRVLVTQGDADRLLAMGWEMRSPEELAAMRARLESKGLEILERSPEEAALRCVESLFAVKDPLGNDVEFYHGRTGCGGAFASPIGVPGFVTEGMGLGHLVLAAAGAEQAAYTFYRDTLGLGDSDTLTLPPMAEGYPPIQVNFLHADNPRHHSLALCNLPSPSGVMHLMVELPSVDEVGRCHDRTLAGGWSLMASLGRHCNDNMFSFYVKGPGGITLEIGSEGRQMDWSTVEPTVSTIPDYWGHAYQF
ncbi:MAG: VOC family protein [Steroidobacteraceae bacterium]